MLTLNQPVSLWTRLPSMAGHWVRALWPVIVVLGLGWSYFRDPILDSIRSTPHPELVYLIFGIAGIVVLLVMWALSAYVREISFLMRLRAMPHPNRHTWLSQGHPGVKLQPLFLAVFAPQKRDNHESVIERRLSSAEEALKGYLGLATYLNGALVGLGLVGTFVGLLDTLSDMGSLFSSMTQMGDKNVDSTQMLGELLTRLQEPMRGMGTAFVASLYGLMSSLILGLVLHSAKRSCGHVMAMAHGLMREAAESSALTEVTPPSIEWNEAAAIWAKSLAAMQTQHQQTLQLLDQFRTEVAVLGGRIQGLEQQMAVRNQRDDHRVSDMHASLQPVIEVISGVLVQQTSTVNVLHDLHSLLQTTPVLQTRAARAKAKDRDARWQALQGLGVGVALVSLGWLLHSSMVVQDAFNSVAVSTSGPNPGLDPVKALASNPVSPEVMQAEPQGQVQAESMAVAPSLPEQAPAENLQIQVREGDTLRCIARRAKVNLKVLLALNPEIQNADLILSKQKLVVPSTYQEGASCLQK